MNTEKIQRAHPGRRGEKSIDQEKKEREQTKHLFKYLSSWSFALQSSTQSMAKEKDPEKERKMLVGIVWNCAEMKFLLLALVFLFSLATLVHFLSSRPSPISPLDMRFCFSKLSPSAAAPTTTLSPSPSPSPSPSFPRKKKAISEDEETHLGNGIIKRAFYPYGWAAYLFVKMGAYRGGLNTFAIVGLASKPLHVYGKPRYECEWIPAAASSNSTISITVPGHRILPDWGYGRIYTVVVVNCTFPEDVGADGSGGRLLLHASTGVGRDKRDRYEEAIEVLAEEPRSLNWSIFTAPPQFDYVYCGSPLYGNLSPQRTREWIAYHAKLFGEKAHFVIHDAGGVHREVLQVLQPWMEKGFVTLQDIRGQERFDGYYHNQFMVVNDCLHRYRFMARWMFFFDIDEYIYLPPKSTIASLLATLSNYSQFTIEQMSMSNKLCRATDKGNTARKWGFEKLVYKDVKRGIRRDRKYAIQPRNVFATGVHLSQNVAGKTTYKTENRIKYFHYHGTISERREPCRAFVNSTQLMFEGLPYVLDETMRSTAASVKRFEIKTIGSRLQRTRQ